MLNRTSFHPSGYRVAVFSLALFICCLVFALYVWAHPDISIQIEQITREIENKPEEGELYLKRAELHRRHGAWLAASLDYSYARKFAPALGDIDFFEARMLVEAGKAESAQVPLNRYLSANPLHSSARLLSAQIASALSDHNKAVFDYALAMQASDNRAPEIYLAWAKELALQGDSRLDDALSIVDRGIADLGSLVTLVDYAIELESARGCYTQALERFNDLPSRLIKSPKWLIRRADLLVKNENPNEARRALEAALEVAQKSEPSRRESLGSSSLEGIILNKLEQLK